MDRYRHTQTGGLMIFIIGIILINFGVVLYRTGIEPAILAILAIVLFLIISFGSLTVRIDDQFIHLTFGYGLVQKKFALNTIKSAKTVKNKWYYGWGIRYNPWKRIWIYNVSGFDAVEITTKDGTVFRIGTDEPQKLEFAIKDTIH